MAIVSDQFTSVQVRTPFVKPTDMTRMFTAIPRALMTFVVNGGVLTAKPVNDQQTIHISLVPDVKFAYRLISMTCMINQGTAHDYTDGAIYRITNGMRGQPLGHFQGFGMTSVETFDFTPITQQKLWHLERIPSGIVQSIAKDVNPVVALRLVNNQAAVSTGGFLNFQAVYYEYDIEQVQMYPPLVPTLVYSMD